MRSQKSELNSSLPTPQHYGQTELSAILMAHRKPTAASAATRFSVTMSMEIGVIETEIMTYLVQHRAANLLD
jgi:hypothetical protein